jgi:hypothetical protein
MNESDGFRQFGFKVSKYFLEFLETDFHRQQAPRRRIQLRNDTNQTTGVALRKYDSLYRHVVNLLGKDLTGNGPRTLNIPHGRFKAPIRAPLRNLIGQYIDQLEPQKFPTVTTAVIDAASAGRASAINDPEKYIDDVTLVLRDTASREIVHPLLALLEKPLQNSSYSAVESIFEIENELVEALTGETTRQMPDALNTLMLEGDDASLKTVLSEFFDENQARQALKQFFDGFATSDVWQEVRDLHALTRMAEEQQLYLYVGDLRFSNLLFPVVYVPLTISQDEQSGEFHLELDSHLYVNKRAIDYVAQELGVSVALQTLHSVADRILYLDPGVAPIGEIDRIFGKLQSLFGLDRTVKLEQVLGVAQSSKVRLSTASYLAVFDRSDEALLNDYEALLAQLRSGPDSVGTLFEKIIRGFLLDDPVDVDGNIREFWDKLEVPARLVTESPIPLNEEQRKAMAALEHPQVNFVVIQGPPGTGKSHTITAIAFDCILKGRTVLVLSDKTEALDVVQEKLTQAINSVRPDQDFLNPILRLGREGGNYARLLSKPVVQKITNQYYATESHQHEIDQNIRAVRDGLGNNILATIQSLSQINLKDVEALLELEQALSVWIPEFVSSAEKNRLPDLTGELDAAVKWQESPSGKSAAEKLDDCGAATVGDALRFMRKATLGSELSILSEKREAFSIFRILRPGDGKIIQQFVARYDDMRMPLFGYLFRGAKVRRLNAEVAEKLPVENFVDLHRRVKDLRTVCELMPRAEAVARARGASDDEFAEVYESVVNRGEQFSDFAPVLALLRALGRTLSEWGLAPLAGRKIGEGESFFRPAEVLKFAVSAVEFMDLWSLLTATESKVPDFDYVADRDQLQQLCAAKMIAEMDGRFVRFCKDFAATSSVLASIIRKKQKFPTDSFGSLRDAFPCIIASIREFAEYIPLKTDMFDLVVIDEASQVSAAQALPALLRAKKVLVLGDAHQFSNVKSTYASNERNAAWVSELLDFFKQSISSEPGSVTRAGKFNVKNSVLDFFEFIRNYEVMLRKHFRGYQELISFSSDYFYGNQLQAVKFRGKPIEEVIKFTELEDDGRREKYKNTNSVEAEFILKQLDEFLDLDEPPTVGVITPFREQVALVSRMVLEQPNARDYQDVLKLKIMTFDTCQGEERQVIFYSMVATRAHDALNFIFPHNLDDTSNVADNLRLQRLNVGFSRAQECIHFVLSKPIAEFAGSIRTVLNHYRKILDEKDKADPGKTDPNSPMEKRLLTWLKATPFYQRNRDFIELRPQFPIGDYLRQLDPNYHHPRYRVDFLLTYRHGDQPINMVIEYDGFSHHFLERERVSEANWTLYCRPEDIERQMTLESYGYKFLRVNRFNLGGDPVTALSERLAKLVAVVKRGNGNHQVVNRIQHDANALANGDMKFCKKCGKSKPLNAFWDNSLKGGRGGHGRYCWTCKRNSQRVAYS